MECLTVEWRFLAIKHSIIPHYASNPQLVVGAGSQAIAMTSDIIPDLFLLDYLLPDTNGIELYDRLHEQNALASVPAILLTAHMIRSDLQQAIKQRQLEALEKPLDIERLLTMIEQGVRSQSSDTCELS